MTTMTIDEMLLFAKILAFVSGNRTITLTDIDKKIAANALKRMADQRLDWTWEQRENYKAMVDLALQMG